MAGLQTAGTIVALGAVVSLTAVLLVFQYGQPRIFFAMARDGLLPAWAAKVHPKYRTPWKSNVVFFVLTALFAAFVPGNIVGEMTSIGTLFAFVVVCAAVLMLRAKRPDARRPFRVPGGPVLPVLGVLSCLYLMVNLTVMTWVRFLVWLDIGMIIYWFYGRTHSPLVDAAEAQRRTPVESFANFLTIAGAMLLFNGFAILLLGLLTAVALVVIARATGFAALPA